MRAFRVTVRADFIPAASAFICMCLCALLCALGGPVQGQTTTPTPPPSAATPNAPRAQVDRPNPPARPDPSAAIPDVYGASDGRIRELAARAAQAESTPTPITDTNAANATNIAIPTADIAPPIVNGDTTPSPGIPQQGATDGSPAGTSLSTTTTTGNTTSAGVESTQTPLFGGAGDTPSASHNPAISNPINESIGALASHSSTGWVWNTLAALGVVIGVILLVRWVLARIGGGGVVAASSPAVQVLSRTAIAPRNHVLLIRLGERILVVGDSAAGLRTLTELTDPDEVANLLADVAAADSNSIRRGFGQLLGKLNRDYDTAEQTAAEGGDHSEHTIDRARDQISSLLSRVRAAHISEEA